MIAVNALISLFERMRDEHWQYVWGGAREGCVDCSGAFVYAFRELDGYKMPYHSSNWMARAFVAGPLVPASEAKPGWAVFKWREESENTPERWKDGRGDFYHVGLMGDDGTVLNAKGTRDGFVASPLKGWQYAAPLKRVNYEEDVIQTVLYKAKVVTQDDPLNMRDAPGGKKLAEIPIGAIVDVLEEGEWDKVRYASITGYASSKFLERIEDKPAPSKVKTELYNKETHQYITLVGDWFVVDSND